MELQKEQVDVLFSFTKKKLVHWYDLQVELVDHLASRIEEEMEKEPKLDFDKALQKVYKGFGIFGFAHIVQEKQAQLERSSRRLWWSAFRSFFAWPKILLIAATVFMLWQAKQHLHPLVVLVSCVLAYLASEIQLWRYRIRERKTSRPLLLLQLSPLRFTTSFFFLQLMLSIGDTSGTALFIFGLICFLCVLINLASFQGHRSVQREAKALYPEAFA
jgi:hypothetical protein